MKKYYTKPTYTIESLQCWFTKTIVHMQTSILAPIQLNALCVAEKKQITILRSLIRPERKSTPRHIALEMRIVAIAHQMMSLLRRRLGRNDLYALVILIYNEQFEETKAVPGYIDKCKHGD